MTLYVVKTSEITKVKKAKNDEIKDAFVVLYKNSSTWILSPTGLIDKLKDGAVNLASTAIDDAFAKINDMAMDKIGEATAVVNNFVKQTIDGAVEALTNSIINLSVFRFL